MQKKIAAGGIMVTIRECTKNNLCVDCAEVNCIFQGQLIADCPKYHCDRGELGFEHCESCAFLREYAKSQREYFNNCRRRSNE